MDKNCFPKFGYRPIKSNKWLAGLFIASCWLSACNNDVQFESDQTAVMQVAVQTVSSNLTSRGVVDGGSLPSGSVIGVSLTAEDGSAYDGVSYYNLPYTASGEGDAQTWVCGGDKTPSLSMTPGKAFAYYPHNGIEGIDLTAIPVETASQTDYMYSKPVSGLTLYSPQANFSMQHALTNIRLVLVNRSFTGNTELKSIKITSPFFGTAATWDATTGAISGVTGTGAELVPVLPDGAALSDTPLQLDIITIADESVTSGNLDIVLMVGNNQFTAKFPITEAFLNGNAYQYTLTLNNSGMTVNGANVTDWVTEEFE